VVISAGQSGFYFVSVTNRDPTDPVDKTYTLEIREILGTATPTRLASVDDLRIQRHFPNRLRAAA
jgi:hypothetical protein